MNPTGFEEQRRKEETSTKDIKNQQLLENINACRRDETEETSVDETISDIKRESQNRMENVVMKRSASNQLL